MNKIALRKRVHNYVDRADYELLEIVSKLFEREMDGDVVQLTPEQIKELQGRIDSYDRGEEKGYSVRQAKSVISKEMKKWK